MSINTSDEEFLYMGDHVIDGKNLLPATGYLFYIWKMMATINRQQHTNMPILFENVRFLRATVLSKHNKVDLIFTLQRGMITKILILFLIHHNILYSRIYFIFYISYISYLILVIK